MAHSTYASISVFIAANNAQWKRADFGNCILRAHGINANRVLAKIDATQGQPNEMLHLRLNEDGGGEGEWAVLGHAVECPVDVIRQPTNAHLIEKLGTKEVTFCGESENHISFLTISDKKQEIRIGVCVLIFHENHVLLTRRAKHMRTFPWRWVRSRFFSKKLFFRKNSTRNFFFFFALQLIGVSWRTCRQRRNFGTSR